MAVFQFLGDLAEGRQRKREAKLAAEAAKIEREQANIRSAQIAEQSRVDLVSTLGTIDAIRASRGVSGDSATGEAIRARTTADAYRAAEIARLAEINRAAVAGIQERGYRAAARWAMPLAVLKGMAGLERDAMAAMSAAGGGGG